jgi:HK97 family phage portal protein
MGLLQRLFGRSNDEKRMSFQGGGWQPTNPNWQPSDYLPPTIGIFNAVGRSDAGIVVDEYSALTASAVYACVSVIANTIGTLPIHVQKKDQAEKVIDHPVYRLLHDEPNELMTSVVFRETMMLNLLLWGHCNAFIEKDPQGIPVALYPLRSAVTRPIRMFGQLLYLTQVGTTMMYLTPDQVFSVVNLTLDGITPISPIMEARQSVGLSLALERFAAKFFGNGSNVGGILTLPPGMKPEAVENFVASWKKKYAGPDNALKIGLLPPDYKFTPTSTDPEKAQALQARVNQIREIARIYRVPLHKVGDLERGTFSNIEFQSREFVSDCLQPWCVKWEQEANRKLFLEREKPSLEVKFDLDGLLRADIAARNAAYMQGRQGGWLTVNEIREKEGLPPVAGGDSLLQPLNMTPIGGGGALTAPTPPKSDVDDQAPASRALIIDAAQRVLTKESKAFARAAKKFVGHPDELRAWADNFYTAHADLVTRAMTASFKAAAIGLAPTDYAKRHCADSIRAIGAAIDAGATADDVIDEWETTRPAEIADQVLTKVRV